MSEEPQQGYHNTVILKELSDIKASLAINTTETANIKQNIVDIKDNMREIKNAFVTQIEFKAALKTISEEISPLKKFVYGLVTTVGIAILVAVLRLVIVQ